MSQVFDKLNWLFQSFHQHKCFKTRKTSGWLGAPKDIQSNLHSHLIMSMSMQINFTQIEGGLFFL